MLTEIEGQEPETRPARRSPAAEPLLRYVIVREEPGAVAPFRTALASGGEALPVFGSPGLATLYLNGLGEGWRARLLSTGEIVSVLSSVCRNVQGVLVDPVFGMTVSTGGAFVGRQSFVHSCLGFDSPKGEVFR